MEKFDLFKRFRQNPDAHVIVSYIINSIVRAASGNTRVTPEVLDKNTYIHTYITINFNIHTNGIDLGVILNLNPWSFQPLLTPSDPVLSSMIKYYIILIEIGY